VAILMAVCGTGLVICASLLAAGNGTDFAREMERIGVLFFIGVCCCVGATLGLVVEGLVRWCLCRGSQPSPANRGEPHGPPSNDQPPADG